VFESLRVQVAKNQVVITSSSPRRPSHISDACTFLARFWGLTLPEKSFTRNVVVGRFLAARRQSIQVERKRLLNRKTMLRGAQADVLDRSWRKYGERLVFSVHRSTGSTKSGEEENPVNPSESEQSVPEAEQ
jgi:hypothetical protein